MLNKELGLNNERNGVDNSSSNSTPIFLDRGVEKGSNTTIRQRLDVLLMERGLKWADVYNKLEWHKSFASKVHNGLLIPPEWQRVALASELGIDSIIIWQINDLMEDKQNGKNKI